jgi:hypothetical protein
MVHPDQVNFYRNIALLNGCPNIRCIDVPRAGSGEERIAAIYPGKLLKALTDPLTAKEKESGVYSPPAPPRVLFTGTLDEAQSFLQQAVLVDNCRSCPIAKYTDGLPVIIPTEEKVAEMLTGTSHKPSEPVGASFDSVQRLRAPGQAAGIYIENIIPAGTPIAFAYNYTATVEKAAICAVMAGCKPEYMPVALAIAESGGGSTNCPGTSSPGSVMFIVSGPIAKEIGMNGGQQAFDVGNQANMTLGRVGALMTVNFGGCITGVVRTDSGHPVHSLCFAEDLEGNPPGWIGFNEESTYYDSAKKANVNYTSKQSVLGKTGGFVWSGFGQSPASYRALNTGLGGMANIIQQKLGIPLNTPGYYNWLEVTAPLLIEMKNGETGGNLWVMNLNMALWLQQSGFKTKAAGYQWLVDKWFIPVKRYIDDGWYVYRTDYGNTIEPTSGKAYKDLPLDYPIHAFGTSPTSSCFIVANSFADENVYVFSGGRPSAYPIDTWR